MRRKSCFAVVIIALLMTASNVYAEEEKTYVSVVSKDINFFSEDENKVTLASNVTEKMCHSEYWKDKLSLSDDYLLMTNAEIDELNDKMIHSKETYMNDLEMITEINEADYEKPSVPKDEYYVDGKIINNEEYFGNMIKAMEETGYDGKIQPQYAIVTKRADVKNWPTNDIVGYSADDTDDEILTTSMNVNEPFIIRQKCVIDGKTFYNGYTTCYFGWVDADNIAICDSREEWLDAWKVDTDSKEHIVVTGDMIMLEPSMYVPEISEVRLMLGTVLKLVPKNEIPVTVGERGTWNNYVVYLPTRDENGKYVRRYALISQHHKVNVGYLPLTQGNVLDVAFNCLGDRYGWGGMLGAMDCSMYTRQIYKCFGLEIPRNTTWQSAIPGRVTDISQMSDDEKLAYFEDIPLGSLLEFDGHITVYIGSENGMAYVISDTGNVTDSVGDNGTIGVMSVIINPLNVRRVNGSTWLENMRNVITFGEKNTDRKHKYGDSDCDGIVSEKDMEYMMKKVLDPKSKMPIEYKINNYMVYFDIDGDGKLTANDVAFISGIKYNYIKNNDI